MVCTISSKFKFTWQIVAVIFCFAFTSCNGNEYFSSISGLENLLQTEVIILSDIKNYLADVTEHIILLESEIKAIEKEHLEASMNLEGYLNNPVNAYRLIKRLHNDWNTFEETVRSEESGKYFANAMAAHRQSLSFPTATDVEGSAMAMVRLQETYNLDVAQVASGILNGVKYGSSMSWQDCFLLGHHLYIMRDFNHTIPWLKQSMKLLTEQNEYNDSVSLEFMEAVAAYHQEMGDFNTSLSIINKVMTIDPERETLQETKIYLENMIMNGVKQGLMHEVVAASRHYHKTNEFKLYEKVCRGEIRPTATEQRPLRCKYHTNNQAYRLIQPFKMEEHYIDPYIVQFHDVVGDEQIEIIKMLAKPHMSRSQVRSYDGAESTTANYRTSNSAWFSYDKSPVMERMLLNVQDLSGLNTALAEELQVANYGMGGHYEPHWDFFTDNLSFVPEDGNRVSTAIYYLSSIEEGGGTAFPFLHVMVQPKKGSLLFWYNLHSSEEPDYRTKHAACPVLQGSKWIANIWLRVRNQDHVRPCGLLPEGDVSIMYRDYD